MARRPTTNRTRRNGGRGRDANDGTPPVRPVDDGPLIVSSVRPVDDGPLIVSSVRPVDDGPLIASSVRPVDDGPLIISSVRPVDDGPLIISSVARSTGRKLVLLPMGESQAAHRALWDKAQLRAQSANESGSAPPEAGGAKIFQHIGVAICAADPDQVAALVRAAGDTKILSTPEDEFILYAAGAGREWLRGYRDAVSHIADNMPTDDGPAAASSARHRDTARSTWGIVATNAERSRLTGKGVRVAVLDTGIDARHPDFRDRAMVAESFIVGQGVHDGNGHGTHCAGVLCGTTEGRIRYGVATEAELHVAKVLSDLGEGPEQGILHGIDWAIEKKCQVVSMSLSAQAPPSALFNQVGKRALDAGTLLIAAAGNDSNRPFRAMPVGYPANSDNIMAVAAVDHRLQVARFSNASSDDGGGRVDIAGPGVGVFSAWSGARRYKQESGTSMATPFVAGVAALLAQASANASAATILQSLRQSARPLEGVEQKDIGAGLVQAPA